MGRRKRDDCSTDTPEKKKKRNQILQCNKTLTILVKNMPKVYGKY